MTEFECNFCQSTFLNKYNLNNHKKSAKFCLEIQNNQNADTNETEIKEKFSCKYCKKNFNRKDYLTRHINICKVKETSDIILLQETNDKLLKDNQKLKIETLELKNKLKNLEKYIIFEKLYNEEKIRYDRLENDYKKIVESSSVTIKENVKSIEKIATKAIENAGNKTINNNSNRFYQQLVPLTNDYIKEQSQFLQLKHVINGAESLAYFAKDYSLKDRVICTDVARRNFIFKDENDTVIKDPKGVKITKRFIENNRAELVRLLKEYALMFYEEDCPYEYKDKIEIDECLHAVQSGDIPSNSDNYNKFETQFTMCFSKLVYSNSNSQENNVLNLE
jgi:hypothetical protein